MRQDIRLYIGGKEIEFNSNPKILFNYKVTDVNNPTVVRNSYTKTIEVEGTPKNNDAFENIWNLERVQFAGINFNPIKKTDFVIYVNGEIYEKGYAKLDGITTKNNKCTYSITLYGGLGSFFYNLSYKNSEGDDRKSLADLYYAKRDIGTVYEAAEPDLTFRISKESLWDAWNTITEQPNAVYQESLTNRPNNYLYDDRWRLVNFAPCYNGVPEDFEASKCLINKNGMHPLTFSKTDGGKTYTDYFGYAMGEQPNDELTEWETFDLRSYLMRPVVSMRRVIEACCNPVNNGGYEIDLDPSFFNYDNPYYDDAYLTLPMLRENIEGGETYTNSTATITKKRGAVAGESIKMEHYNVNFTTPTISDVTNVNLSLLLDLSINSPLANNTLYMYKKLNATPSQKGDTKRVKSLERISSVAVQLVALDELDRCVASSNVYFITDTKAAGNADFIKDTLWYESAVPVPDVTNVYGKFKRIATGRYRLVDGNGDAIALGFNFNSDKPFKRLELKMLPITHEIIYYMNPYKWWKSSEYNGVHKMETYSDLSLFAVDYEYYSGDIGIDTAMSRGAYVSTPNLIIPTNGFQLVAKDYSDLFSNTLIRKDNLLKTDKTPADYLISYAKMFGLYFYSDPAEIANDPESAPNGVIHIMTRDTYYDGEIVDLEEIIDRNKGMKITPSTPNSKWVNFNVEQVESEANKEYKNKYGYDYGYQKVNTGFDFNADDKALLDKVVYKGGIEVLETSKYYQRPINGYPAYGENGFIYTLYEYGDGDINTLEVNDNFGAIFRNSINPNGWDDADAFKKPQFHEAENKGTDGKDVLLFYTAPTWYDDNLNYWITDDLPEMVTLNDGKPCWIMTMRDTDVNGKRIAYPINLLPIFQRNLIYATNGTIMHSWDFGNSQMTFVRDTYVGDESSIYSKCWRDFISDQYSQDNRILSTYVVFKDRPNSGMLRKFYWFDNCLWRMNAVKDWDIAELQPTAVEFVKVIDTKNYELKPITTTIIPSFTFPNLENVDEEYGGGLYEHYYKMPYTATTTITTAMIDTGNAGSWCFGDSCHVLWEDGMEEYYEYDELMTPTNTCGSGDGLKTFSFPMNTRDIPCTWEVGIYDNDDRFYRCYIIQGERQLTPVNPIDEGDTPADTPTETPTEIPTEG